MHSRFLAAVGLALTLAACGDSPTGPTGIAGRWAMVEYGGEPLPMTLRRPAGWVGLYCADLLHSEVLDLRGDGTASLAARGSFECEGGGTPVPDSSTTAGSYTASGDSVFLRLPYQGGAAAPPPGLDALTIGFRRARDSLVYAERVYTESAGVDTFRIVFVKQR